jgi:HEPN domain-containing protein
VIEVLIMGGEMTDIDFDAIKQYDAEGENFKSHNNDSNFKLNCIYFKYSKPYKIGIEFWGDENSVFGIIDLLFWPNTYYEVKPTQARIDYKGKPKKPLKFEFYANPFFRKLGEGKFEPRVYNTGNISKLVVKKMLQFKDDDWSKYAMFLIRRAKDMYDLAHEKANGQVYGLCLHFSRFCIELSLKSIFPLFQKTVPHTHEVSEEVSIGLRQQICRKAPEFIEDLPRLLWISQLHIRPGRLDFYGDPISRAPSDLFITQEEGITALKDAELCYQKCCKLFEKMAEKK